MVSGRGWNGRWMNHRANGMPELDRTTELHRVACLLPRIPSLVLLPVLRVFRVFLGGPFVDSTPVISLHHRWRSPNVPLNSGSSSAYLRLSRPDKNCPANER